MIKLQKYFECTLAPSKITRTVEATQMTLRDISSNVYSTTISVLYYDQGMEYS